jgi:hypothetical protein
VRRCLFAFLVFFSANLNCSLAQLKPAPSPAPSEPPASHLQGSPSGSEKLKRPNGLLLGTHWPVDSGEEQSGDRTWWIAEIGAEIQIREIPNLLIPRKDGFWVGGTKEIKRRCYFESYIWTAPRGTPPKSYDPGISDADCHDERTMRDFLFVGTNQIAVQQFQSGTGAVYDEGTQFYVSTIEHPNWNSSENKTVQISDVLGIEGTQAFNKALGAMGVAKDESIDCGKMDARPTDWAIRREKGRWLLKGSGSRGGHVCDGYFGTEFDIKMKPPKNLVGYDELLVGWDKIEKAFPDARDAFESPNQNFAIIIVGQKLVVCWLANGEIGTVVARQPLRENEYAVMVQWALGDNVARWDKQMHESGEPSAK